MWVHLCLENVKSLGWVLGILAVGKLMPLLILLHSISWRAWLLHFERLHCGIWRQVVCTLSCQAPSGISFRRALGGSWGGALRHYTSGFISPAHTASDKSLQCLRPRRQIMPWTIMQTPFAVSCGHWVSNPLLRRAQIRARQTSSSSIWKGSKASRNRIEASRGAK